MPEASEEHAHEPVETSPGDSSVPPEQEDRIVDKVVDKVRGVFEDLMGSGGSSRDGDSPSTGAAPSGPAATEADMESKVKKVVEEQITTKERRNAAADARRAHDEEHERMRDFVERPPKTFSRLTTAIWGGGDDS